MKPLHLMVSAAAALPVVSGASEMVAAASLHTGNNDENIHGVPTGAGGHRHHKRARQMQHPVGSTGPAGLHNPDPNPISEPVRSPYHIVSDVFQLLRPFIILANASRMNLMNLSSSLSNMRRSLTADRRDRDCIYLNSYTTQQSPRLNVSGEVRPRL